MIVFGFSILLVYVFFLFWLYIGMLKMKRNQVIYGLPKTHFSIIIAFRNEAENLPNLLHSLSNLNYPKELFEVILVDDNSDGSWKLEVGSWKFKIVQIKNISKTNSPKKDAINSAIAVAKNDWVVTTDADCLVQKNWLLALDAKIKEVQARMLVCGVQFVPKIGFLYHFQNLDFLSLQGITAGSFVIGKPFMCNGANFAYEKSFFKELNGFEGNSEIASGDDVFLLQKAIQFQSDKVHYITNKDSVVYTKSETSWKSLFNQRVRWASKSSAYMDWFSKSLAVVVFLTNFLLVVGCWLLVVGLLSYENLLFYFGIKFLVDFIMIMKSADFFNQRVRYVLISSLVYPFFNGLVGIFSLFGKYSWKERKFNK